MNTDKILDADINNQEEFYTKEETYAYRDGYQHGIANAMYLFTGGAVLIFILFLLLGWFAS